MYTQKWITLVAVLRLGRPMNRISNRGTGGRFFLLQNIHTDSGVNSASYSLGTARSFTVGGNCRRVKLIAHLYHGPGVKKAWVCISTIRFHGYHKDNLNSAIAEVLIAKLLKIQVFWDDKPCSLVYSYRHFDGYTSRRMKSQTVLLVRSSVHLNL